MDESYNYYIVRANLSVYSTESEANLYAETLRTIKNVCVCAAELQ